MAEVSTSARDRGNIATNVVGGWAANDAESALSTADEYDGQGSLAINVSDGGSHEFTTAGIILRSTGGVCSAIT